MWCGWGDGEEFGEEAGFVVRPPLVRYVLGTGLV